MASSMLISSVTYKKTISTFGAFCKCNDIFIYFLNLMFAHISNAYKKHSSFYSQAPN